MTQDQRKSPIPVPQHFANFSVESQATEVASVKNILFGGWEEINPPDTLVIGMPQARKMAQCPLSPSVPGPSAPPGLGQGPPLAGEQEKPQAHR